MAEYTITLPEQTYQRLLAIAQAKGIYHLRTLDLVTVDRTIIRGTATSVRLANRINRRN
jgi:hypothetical protein